MTGWYWQAIPVPVPRSVRPSAGAASWDAWKVPGNDGRAACELRERCLWQSVLGLPRPPELVDLPALAAACRRP